MLVSILDVYIHNSSLIIDYWLSAHGTSVILLQPFFKAVHVKDVLVRAVEFCNLLTIGF